jgi:(p)ppGpp synthase/HD superfamily hydrolase
MKEKIIDFVKQKHGNQLYGDKPYFYHLENVAKNIEKLSKKKLFIDQFGVIDNLDDLILCGYLHDVLEDTDCTIFELKDLGLSDSSIETISLLTKTEFNKETYLENIKTNKMSRIVKIADTMHNLSESINSCNYKFI